MIDYRLLENMLNDNEMPIDVQFKRHKTLAVTTPSLLMWD